MKKVLTVLTVVAFVAAFTSCKKDYECCYYDNGVKVTSLGFGCITAKMSKKEKEDLESTGTSAALLLGWTYECK